MSTFNKIRKTLIDPSEDKTRKELVEVLSKVKVASVLTGIASILSGILVWNVPFIGPLMGVTGIVLVPVATREVYVMANNTEKLYSDHLVNRTYTSLTASKFVDTIFADTWLAKELLGPTVKRRLDE